MVGSSTVASCMVTILYATLNSNLTYDSSTKIQHDPSTLCIPKFLGEYLKHIHTFYYAS